MPLFSIPDIARVQSLIDEALAEANSHLRAPPSPSHFLELSGHISEISSLLEAYQHLEDRLPDELFNRSLHRLETALESLTQSEANGPLPICSLRPTSTRTIAGRQKVDISCELLREMVEQGYTTKEMADALEVGMSTIERRKKEFQLVGIKIQLSDEDAEELVRSVMEEGNTNIGEVAMKAELLKRGWEIPRKQLRTVMGRVDRVGQIERWVKAVQRRAYFVAFVNSLWHIDGHHKLIRWGFVVHGGIDGKTRFVTFLKCSTNNEAQTVGEAFYDAAEEFGWPSRVRADHGGENLVVKKLMEDMRGTGRGSFIQGTSTHNQRIERLWRDLFRWKLKEFYVHFHELEGIGYLSADDAVDTWCLQLVYLPVINLALKDFQESWNLHRVRTERSTPAKMRSKGITEALRAGFDVMKSPFGEEQSLDDDYLDGDAARRDFINYGIIFGRARRSQDTPHVLVPAITQPIPDEEAIKLYQWVEIPDHVDFKWASDTYIECRKFCHSVLASS